MTAFSALAAGVAGFRGPVAAGLAAALALVLPSYLGLSWALALPDKKFYSIFVGGTLARFLGLAAAGALVYFKWRPHVTAVLLAMVGGMMALSLVEIAFLLRQTRMPK